ncbi:MAG: archaellin/type IV pilin N-terminal domain-containing protein [Candidatus Woesearchaeota archaeon]
MNFLKSKKGVSPLIATVLLIAFAVALGAVVMNWGRTYVEDTARFAREKSDLEIKCSSDVKLDFLKIKDVKHICYYLDGSNVKVNFTIENIGKLDVYGLQVTVVGSKEVNTTEINLEDESKVIKRARFYKNMSVPLGDIGTPSQIRIVPIIKIEGNKNPCPGTALVEEDFFPNCANWTTG